MKNLTVALLLLCQFLLGAKPNIIFIMADDLGWTGTGFNGSKYYETPRLDKMAEEGINFTHAYSNSANCAPSRAALISGQYAPRTGVYTAGTSSRGVSRNRKLIPTTNSSNVVSNKITVAEAMKDGGYNPYMIGKWHLGSVSPSAQGFTVLSHSGPSGQSALADREAGGVLNFLDNSGVSKQPFFVYLSFNFPHLPLGTTSDLEAKYTQKAKDLGVDKAPDGTEQNNPLYAGMVESIDNNVGKILDKLVELKLDDNTLVIFFSDNGGTLERNSTVNTPLRSSKGTLYEGGIRVPMFARWPGVIKPGTASDVPVIGTDFYPTFLDVGGIAKPDNYILDGQSILPILKGEGFPERKPLQWHYPVYLQSYLAIQGMWRTTPAGAIRAGDYKLIEFFEYGQLELYNIKEDISESKNLIKTMPGKAHELRELMYAWRDDTKAPVPTELNPDYNPDSIPQGYTTYDDIKAQVKTGCTDPAYGEFNKDANAMEPGSCKALDVSDPGNFSTHGSFRFFEGVIRILTGSSHSIKIHNLSGELIFNKQGTGNAVYKLRKTIQPGTYIASVKNLTGTYRSKIIIP